jgi:hypothetical protein
LAVAAVIIITIVMMSVSHARRSSGNHHLFTCQLLLFLLTAPLLLRSGKLDVSFVARLSVPPSLPSDSSFLLIAALLFRSGRSESDRRFQLCKAKRLLCLRSP